MTITIMSLAIIGQELYADFDPKSMHTVYWIEASQQQITL